MTPEVNRIGVSDKLRNYHSVIIGLGLFWGNPIHQHWYMEPPPLQAAPDGLSRVELGLCYNAELSHQLLHVGFR
jgi:hypothetical protein